MVTSSHELGDTFPPCVANKKKERAYRRLTQPAHTG
jgi:hypothetical protein